MVALLLSVVALCYIRGQYDQPIFDDIGLIERNESIRNIDHLPGLIGLGSEKVPSHRVVRNLTYALDFQLWGPNLRGFHLTNLFIHLLNVLLVLSVGSQLLPRGPWAFLAALLWGVHPVHTESVTYLSGRRDVLSAFFFLWSFWFYLRADQESTPRRDRFLCFFLYVLGCFTKEVTVTLPGILVIHELVAVFRQTRGDQLTVRLSGALGVLGARFRRSPVFFVSMGLFPLFFTGYILRFHPFNVGAYYLTPPLQTNLASVAQYGAHYLWLLIFPRDLSTDYFPESLPPSQSLLEPWTLIALSIHAILALLTAFAFFRGSMAAFGGLWFVVCFLPMSNLIIRCNEPVAEHYLYLPSIGFAWALVTGLERICVRVPRVRPLLLTLTLGLTLALCGRTFLRNIDWENAETLYKSSLAVFSRNSRVLNNLGCHYMSQGDFAGGLSQIDKALSVSPKESLFLYNKAFCLRKLGRLREAQLYYRKALEITPEYLDALLGMAFNLILLKEFDQALATYDKVLTLEQDRIWYIHHWRAVACREKGDLSRSREAFRLALDRGKRHPETLWQMALLAQTESRRARGLKVRSRQDEAITLMKEALSQAPESAVLHGVLGNLYEEMGRLDLALEQILKMGQVNEEYAVDSAVQAARIHERKGELEKARESCRRAQSLGYKGRCPQP